VDRPDTGSSPHPETTADPDRWSTVDPGAGTTDASWLEHTGYRPAGAEESARANRGWWNAEADSYLAEHGEFLGEARFVWCPEGLDEADGHLLGDVRDRDVLEVGCGAGQCTAWLRAQGARAIGLDQSASMLRRARDRSGLVLGDARALPFPDATFDLACSAFGAVPFVADPERIMAEVARVLRPGGRWVFAVSHPVRWAFPDDPGPGGLTAHRSYFDRTPYVEQDDAGRVRYAEHHRTLGDRIRDVVRAGLVVEDLVEPEWPDHHDRTWGGWSPLRGRLLPGTAILVTRRP
jgi:SAM-dependent methyltransferase